MLLKDMEYQPLKDEIKTLCQQDEFFQDVRIAFAKSNTISKNSNVASLLWVLSDKCLYAVLAQKCIAKVEITNGKKLLVPSMRLATEEVKEEENSQEGISILV